MSLSLEDAMRQGNVETDVDDPFQFLEELCAEILFTLDIFTDNKNPISYKTNPLMQQK
jgi:hypothetical protein